MLILDQNAISSLALNPNRTWLEILELLRAAIKARKLLCPTPVETINESVHLPRADRKRIEHLCDELSGGYFVKFFWQILAQEVLATVRPNTDVSTLWIPERRNEISDYDSEKMSQRILRDKEMMEAYLNSFERSSQSHSGGS